MNENLQDKFLIAMPELRDINFSRAVIYVCAHNEEGAMGIIINHPLVDIDLGEVMKQMDIDITTDAIEHLPVLLGGPMQPERGFILHKVNKSWDSTLNTSELLAVTSSQDILKAMAEGQGPDEFLVLLGYAGWAPGQIEQEIANNDWLVAPSDPTIIFNTPFESRWQKAAELIGVNLSNLSGEIGHA